MTEEKKYTVEEIKAALRLELFGSQGSFADQNPDTKDRYYQYSGVLQCALERYDLVNEKI